MSKIPTPKVETLKCICGHTRTYHDRSRPKDSCSHVDEHGKACHCLGWESGNWLDEYDLDISKEDVEQYDHEIDLT